MSCQSISKLPQDVQKLPRKGQLAFKAVLNMAFVKNHNEGKAFKYAWAVVYRTGYKSVPVATTQTVGDHRQTIAKPMDEEGS